MVSASAPSVSFLIVNYHAAEKVARLVESIRSKSSDFEIILVDNASSAQDRSHLNRLAGADLTCVFNQENLGFGMACNLAARLAKAKILVLINPDAEFQSGDPLPFFTRHCTTESVGVVAPRIVYPDGGDQPNFARRFSTTATFIAQILSLGPLYRRARSAAFLKPALEFLGKSLFGDSAREYLGRFGSTAEPSSCAWVSGACLGLRKEVFDQLGGFDERFFLYSEDEDLCRRVRALGLAVLYVPELRVMHEVGGTQTSPPRLGVLGWATFHRTASALKYLSKHRGRGWPLRKGAFLLAAVIRVVLGLYWLRSAGRCCNLLRSLASIGGVHD